MDFTLFAFHCYLALIFYKCTVIALLLKLQRDSNFSTDLAKDIKDFFQQYHGRKCFSVLPVLVSMV